MSTQLTAEHLASFSGNKVNDNMRSAVAGLEAAGQAYGLHYPHRLVHFLSQTGHESGLWRYDQEIWGPTAAQSRYDVRTDLGNTPERDGDGYAYRGRGGIQITGKSNYQQFTDWCKSIFPDAPDFVKNPELINTDPWEGLVPIWYWATRNLNEYADANNHEMLTRRINGGLNGYEDRLRKYTAMGLILLGYEPNAVKRFQAENGLTADGIPGPKTRNKIHAMLRKMDYFKFGGEAPAAHQLLKRGDKGEAVKIMQGFLIGEGYGIIADGDFGGKTEKALKAYQKSKGLLADGKYGVKTHQMLTGENP